MEDLYVTVNDLIIVQIKHSQITYIMLEILKLIVETQLMIKKVLKHLPFARPNLNISIISKEFFLLEKLKNLLL